MFSIEKMQRKINILKKTKDNMEGEKPVEQTTSSTKSWVSMILSIMVTVSALYVAWVRCGNKFEWGPILMALFFSPFYLIYALFKYFTEKPVQTQQQKRRKQQQQKRNKAATATPTA